MECLLIFDHLNDVVYKKYNEKFADFINEFAKAQGLDLEPDANSFIYDDTFIIQIFSPIITSQRIMSCQFGNSYTSIQCDNDLNMCFDEYMGYLFVGISHKEVCTMKRFLSICITIVRYLCGPNVCQLKSNQIKAEAVTRLINTWQALEEKDQAIYVEAVEQLVVNTDLSAISLQVLRKSVDKLLTTLECQKIHALIFVKNTVLSLYSSQNAKELAPNDVIFANLVSESCKGCQIDGINSLQVLLAGSELNPVCLAHVIHTIPICEDINLLYLLEIGNLAVSSSLYETFCHLHVMQFVQIQRDVDTLRPAFNNLDSGIKRLGDALKKCKIQSIDCCAKQVARKWEIIRKKYLDFIKTGSDEAILRAETLTLGLLENLKELLALTSIDEQILISSKNQTIEAAEMVLDTLRGYNDFLKVKAIKNFTLGSDSLTINKYLEEFPGLVHFLYVDRSTHRMTAPSIDFEASTNQLTKKKIWWMIRFSRRHLQEGTLSLMWKDNVFNYSYFLWFEDTSGTPLKPLVFPTNSSRALPLPGLFSDDFYRKLKEVCFPKMAPQKIRCYELFCIHLGLVTSSCVLEHTRRLSATIWELRGMSGQPLDLL